MAYAQERYLGLLSQLFTTPEETAMEIIAEREELRFPKPTELFISDIHGEYEEFSHILRNGCGSIRKHIDALFSDSLDEDERSALATLVYYPEKSIDQLTILGIPLAILSPYALALQSFSPLKQFLMYAQNHLVPSLKKSCPQNTAPVARQCFLTPHSTRRPSKI